MISATQMGLANTSGGQAASHAGTLEETGAGAAKVLGLVRRLCEELRASRIDYCHWKSTAALDKSADGTNDLDFLVSHPHVQSFSAILRDLGFKLALDRPAYQLPGVLDYYGYDGEADALVHVHAHYQLVLGHDATKNYSIPVEREYLSSSVSQGLFRVPSPEYEYIIFVLRMMIKHSTWDVILGGQGALSSAERQELEYLSSRVSHGAVRSILAESMCYIPPELFDSCVACLHDVKSHWLRARTGGKLLRALRPCSRRSQVADVALKVWRRLIEGIERRVFKREGKKRLACGGLLIGIVGGDGAGKTTAVDALMNWLSNDFHTVKLHLGKPPWSSATVILRSILKIGVLVGLYPFERDANFDTLDASAISFPGYPWLVREVCTARDRFLLAAKARRLAANGALVISDRFPLPEIKLMDGPMVERMTVNHKRNPFIRFMIRLEQAYYMKIPPPDLVILLRAHPEITVRRKTDEPPDSVRSRTAEILALDSRRPFVEVIDSNRSKEEVLSELKARIWSRL